MTFLFLLICHFFLNNWIKPFVACLLVTHFIPVQIQNRYECSAVFQAFFYSCNSMFWSQLRPSSSSLTSVSTWLFSLFIVGKAIRGPWCHDVCWNPTPAAGRSCAGVSTGPPASVQVKAHSRKQRLEVNPRRAASAAVLERNPSSGSPCTTRQSNQHCNHQPFPSDFSFFWVFLHFIILFLMSTAGASPSGTERASFLCAPRSAKDLRSSGLDSLERSAADRNTMARVWGGCSPASSFYFLWLQPEPAPMSRYPLARDSVFTQISAAWTNEYKCI